MDLAVAGYRSPEDFVAVVRSLAERAGPRATVEQIGTTVQGRPIDVVTVRDRAGDDGHRAQVLVVACMHGCEVISSELAVAVLADYCGPEPRGAAAAVLADADVTVVPCVNVDGRTAAMASLDQPGWFANAPAATPTAWT